MRYRKRFSKSAKRDFAIKMEEIQDFCLKNKIQTTRSNDSYYFTIDNINYRVSNHAVESRNKGNSAIYRGYNLDDKRDDNIIYIHASKTRIIEIYNNLKNGKKLNARGQIIG